MTAKTEDHEVAQAEVISVIKSKSSGPFWDAVDRDQSSMYTRKSHRGLRN